MFEKFPRGDYSLLDAYTSALASAEKLIYLENQFLWSPEVVGVLADKLRNPPSDDFRIVLLLPAKANDGADVSCGQVAALIEADDDNARFLACTLYARAGNLRDLVYVHAKIGIVDDRWLTVGSANLNSHSLFNDTELNVVTLDPRIARDTRLRLWSEHLELPVAEVEGDPTELVERYWEPIAEEQLERMRAGAADAPPGQAARRLTPPPPRARPDPRPHLRPVGSDSRPRRRGPPCISSSATSAAFSAGAPKRSRRPPKAMLHAQSQAQPKRTPAMTSESQCTPSITRLQATPAASPAAAPKMSARWCGVRPAATSSAAAHQERRRAGRVPARERRAECLRDRVELGTHAVEDVLDPVRRAAPGRDDDCEERDDPAARPADVLDDRDDERERDDEARVAEPGEGLERIRRPVRRWSTPHWPTLRSIAASSEFDRMRYASMPMTSPATMMTRSASERARPVAVAGSTLPRRWRRRRRCSAIMCPISRAAASLGCETPAVCG